jgi:hypothetical protein
MRWLFLLISVLASLSLAEAQTETWKTQSPRKSGFSVKVPLPLRQVTWFEGKHGISLEPIDGSDRSVTAFATVESNPSQFGIVIWRVPEEDRKKFNRLDFGGTYFIIGGDDATATTKKIVKQNGLIGREYVYDQGISEDTYTRGRIFYARGRLYILVFVARRARDLASPMADRFLNSFRIHKVRPRSSRGTRRRVAPQY